jgi:hypothetical protein
VNPGSVSGKKSLNAVTVLFKLPYYTQWGQSLLIAGSEPALESWNVKHGLALSPVHQDNKLFWCGRVSVVADFTPEYCYYVVDDNKNVLRSESGEKRKLVLPEGIQEGDVVEIGDWWQVLIGVTMHFFGLTSKHLCNIYTYSSVSSSNTSLCCICCWEHCFFKEMYSRGNLLLWCWGTVTSC